MADGPQDSADAGFVDDYLLYLLAAASERASGQFHASVREAGLRVPEWRVLACLYDRDGAMITELANRALMEQSRMTKVIDQMDKRGLVRRTSDQTDKRRVRIELTDKGAGIAHRLVAAAKQHETGVLSKIADTDAARIKPVLKTLLAHLEESKGPD
ncbi:MarR family winged helix-turn-helix transcriptional regulator [Jannaschia sp. CCS1]|uniref:MarR family winged helix-turn-helix transcriptional regulator n=1 Tax=Jannaschia sp. (strain CCS1) TaxID=290400 RepID=UPI000053A6DE|nr:MarR family transcriptional regulator [Jannaschia sp. CCS1]ABD54258.1 transcriptional regulator, MarR family [Jannaschia sp. CCS1]